MFIQFTKNMPILRVSKRAGGRRMYGKRKRSMVPMKLSPDSSRYLKSILNPSYGGAKIPDSFGAKSCTIQLQREMTLTIANDGTAGGVLQLSICPVAWQKSGSSWSLPTLIDGGPGGYNNYDDQAALNPNDLVGSRLPQIFRTARVVSGGLKVQFSGTTQNDQGTITVFSVDRPHLASRRTANNDTVGDITQSVGNPAFLDYGVFVDPIGNSSSVVGSGSSMRNLPVNAFGPLRMGATARYFPVDDSDLDFHPFPIQSTVTGTGAPSWGTATAQALFGQCRTGTVGALGFLVENAATSGASVIVQYTVNLECTVKDDSFNIVQTQSSPVDPIGLAASARVYLRKPQVRVGGSMGDTESINVYSR